MSKHTGGPWQQKHQFDREGMLTIIGNVDGEYIDGVPHCTYTSICEVDDNEEGIANARLIAAAPNMFAALKAIVEFEASPDFTLWATRLDAARAALAEAGAK